MSAARSLRGAELRLTALAPLLAEAETGGLGWLGEDERTRLGAMRSEPRRNQFLAGHWLLRRLACEVLGGEPAQWLVSAGPDGVPGLQSAAYDSGRIIPASISHSGDRVAAAIAPFPVGIDLECQSRPRDLQALAEMAFSPTECAELIGLPESERASTFYLYWTLKEAVGKREGRGLRPELSRRQRPFPCAAGQAEVFSWQAADFSLALAGEAGMSVGASLLPNATKPGYWRIEYAGS